MRTIKPYRFVLMLLMGASLILTSCKKSESAAVTDKSTDEILDELLASQSKFSNHERLEKGTIEYDDYLDLKYDMLSYEPMLEGCIADSLEATADEFAVFHILSDKTSTDTKAPTTAELEEKFESFILDRKAVFTGYAPLEIAKLDKAQISIYGDYVILIICEDIDAASDAAANCFSNSASSKKAANDAVTATPTSEPLAVSPTSVPSTEPTNTAVPDPTVTSIPTDNPAQPISNSSNSDFVITDELKAVAVSMFDNSKIVAAYKSGDSSQLTDEKDLAILKAAQEVINNNITDGMSDFEMECAIHDYMIQWADYDSNALTFHNAKSIDADNPYGFFIHRYGICSGYTTTFQLFMDMLDIPCLSIQGKAGSEESQGKHAWNMAQIDGIWYYVDVTWDDPMGIEFPNSTYVTNTYLNTTTAIMEGTGHFWNSDLYPEVTQMRNK